MKACEYKVCKTCIFRGEWGKLCYLKSVYNSTPGIIWPKKPEDKFCIKYVNESDKRLYIDGE